MNIVDNFARNPGLVLESSPASGESKAVSSDRVDSAANSPGGFDDILSDLSKRNGESGDPALGSSQSAPTMPTRVRQTFAFISGSIAATEQGAADLAAAPNAAAPVTTAPARSDVLAPIQNNGQVEGRAASLATPTLPMRVRQTFALMSGLTAATEQGAPDLTAAPKGAPPLATGPALVEIGVDAPVQSDVQADGGAAPRAIQVRAPAELSAHVSGASTAATLQPFVAGQDLGIHDLVLVKRAQPEREQAPSALSAGDKPVVLGDEAPDAVGAKDKAPRRNDRAEAESSASVSIAASAGDDAAGARAGGVEGCGSVTLALATAFATAPAALAPSLAASNAPASITSAGSSLAAALAAPTAAFVLVGAPASYPSRTLGGVGQTQAPLTQVFSDVAKASALAPAAAPVKYMQAVFAETNASTMATPHGASEATRLIFPPVGQGTGGVATRSLDQARLSIQPPIEPQAKLSSDLASDVTAPARIKVAVLGQQTHFPPANGLSPMRQLADWVAAEANSAAAALSEAAAAGSSGGPIGAMDDARSQALASPVKILNLQLEPESLGSVTIRLRLSGTGLDLQVEAARPETMRLLSADKDLLANKLRSSGYSMDTLVIKVVEQQSAQTPGGFGAGHGGSQSTAQANAQAPSSAASQDRGSSANDRSPAQKDRGLSRAPAVENVPDGSGARNVGGAVYL